MTKAPRFNRVHAICIYLRNGMKPQEQACQLCPAWHREKTPYGTRWQKGCYGLAQEVLNIAVHGNPWGKKTKRKSVQKWRKRFNKV